MIKEHNSDGMSFDGLGISPKILGILDKMEFITPTPIQYKAIPIAIEGKDMMGVAQTGTGKTLAFAIPIIQRLSNAKGKALIIAPTRELVMQIEETFRKITPAFNMRTVPIIGGVSMVPQLNALRYNPRIVIATPGRLVDHMTRNTIKVNDVEILVLDEADRMLDMGFLPDIKRVLNALNRQRQTMLFSATIPNEIMKIASMYMNLPIHIEVAPSGTLAENIIQELFIVKKEDKRNILAKLLEQYYGPILLFSRTKHGARDIRRFINDQGHSASEIHSDRSFRERQSALEGFKTGKYKVLVATDIAARGIDVTGIEVVINYDLPEDSEQYVHRIGRTGRAGHKGRAISLATLEQGKDVYNIERFIKAKLPVSEHSSFSREDFIQNTKPRSASRYGASRGYKSSGYSRDHSRNRDAGHSRSYSNTNETSNNRAKDSQKHYQSNERDTPRNEYSRPYSHGAERRTGQTKNYRSYSPPAERSNTRENVVRKNDFHKNDSYSDVRRDVKKTWGNPRDNRRGRDNKV
ncbi:DEAD/DEAH box helicase [Candidatus Omnitrophus magneticus]|uniref:DEAD/DEAH box helicase n=1 Tax=Candidatus Omnitrophus magneticus TaxID=1609969 RepID=A0A0F0CR01_9BACT|nr:DEAD/DEAH box helicase [Candidatus Omnitrophus magneticus]